MHAIQSMLRESIARDTMNTEIKELKTRVATLEKENQELKDAPTAEEQTRFRPSSKLYERARHALPRMRRSYSKPSKRRMRTVSN